MKKATLRSVVSILRFAVLDHRYNLQTRVSDSKKPHILYNLPPFAGLDAPQARIDAIGGNQIIVTTLLNELTMFQDEDSVSVADGGQSVGDDDSCTANGDLLKRTLDEGLRLVIDRGCGFV
jgi:hypothetical protein